MTTRRTPDGQVYTEVPVVPRHDQLDGRTLGNSHPISAITGLQEALDAKADAVDGGNLVTDEEKAKIETMEANAQENVVEVVKVNGAALTPDASKAVDVEVPTAYGKTIAYSAANGRLTLKGPTGSTLSEATIPRKGLTAMALNSDSKVLSATLQDGSTVTVDISAAADPYEAGNGLALADGAFSLSSQTEGLLEDLADHLSDQTAHVSSADRTKWDGVAANAVKVTGNQTIAGSKTFSSPVTVGTPTAVSHAATKAYVDAAVEGAGGGGGDMVPVPASEIGADLFEELFEQESSDPFLVYKALKDVQICAFVHVDVQQDNAWPDLFIPKGALVTSWLSATSMTLGAGRLITLGFDLEGMCTGSDMTGAVLIQGLGASEDPEASAFDVELTYSSTPYYAPSEPQAGDFASVCILRREDA